jgi:hypothetical protein
MQPPEDDSDNPAEYQRNHEKPAEFGQADKTHHEQSNHNEQTDGMSGPMASAVTTEGNHIRRARSTTPSLLLFMILRANANWEFHASPHSLSLCASRSSQRALFQLRWQTLARFQVVEKAFDFGVAVEAVQFFGDVVVEEVHFGGRCCF